jgi:gliding motility-associated lipoprotein GldD
MKWIVGFVFLIMGCSSPDIRPKPRSYPRVIFPDKNYSSFNQIDCPFTFNQPSYTNYQPDTQLPVNPCWFDLYYPDFDARLHFSYYPLKSGVNALEKLKQDAFKMADWHNKRANYIDEVPIENGFIFFIDGPAASPLQFYLTDSIAHFLRGSLYYNTAVEPDSLAPINDFIQKDVMTLIETLQWKY